MGHAKQGCSVEQVCHALFKSNGNRDRSPTDLARIMPGALILKHIESLDDRGTIAIIQENPYMQYFLGLEEFDPNPVFVPIRTQVFFLQPDGLYRGKREYA